MSRRAILAAGMGLIAVVLVATAIVLVVLRAEALQGAESHLGNLATALGEQTRRSVAAVEILVKATVHDLEERSPAGRRRPDAELYQRMRNRMEMLPDVHLMAFIDSRGDAVLHSTGFPTPAVNYGDREYFRAHLERRIEGLYIGVPVFGRRVPEWLNVFSCRVEDTKGRFLGIVAAGVAVPHLQKLYAELNLGPDGRVFLFRADGILLAMHPAMEGVVGRSFEDDALFAQAVARPDAFAQRGAGLVDDKPRIIASQPLEGYPLVIAVSSTRDHILSRWWRDAWRIGAGATGIAVILGLALFFLLRQRRIDEELAGEVRESVARLDGIIESAMDAIIAVDERQRIVMFNTAAEKIFRCPAAEAVGGPLERFIPERFRAQHRAHIEQFGSTGATTRMMGARLDLRGLRADGEEFPIDASISRQAVEGRKLYTVILRDITERKRADVALERSHQELRALSASMNEVREAERARIARELHDELAQSLTALKMDVSWLAGRLPPEDGRARMKVERMKGLVDSTVTSVRQLAHDLRPAMLDDLGIVPAIEHLLHEFSERTGVVVELDADAHAIEFREPLTTAVYRMVQEALTNVARHARATEVRVAIRAEGDELDVSARDNGVGISAEKLQGRKSLGILGIKERARTLGGSAEIHSPGDGGTVVEIRVPVRHYRSAGAGA
jgi:PAS domain S-box-containing protein